MRVRASSTSVLVNLNLRPVTRTQNTRTNFLARDTIRCGTEIPDKLTLSFTLAPDNETQAPCQRLCDHVPSELGSILRKPVAVLCPRKLQALLYDILPLEEGAGKRCSECGVHADWAADPVFHHSRQYRLRASVTTELWSRCVKVEVAVLGSRP